MIGSLLHHHLNCFFNTLYIEIRETENQKEKNKLSGKNKEEFGAGFRVKSGSTGAAVGRTNTPELHDLHHLLTCQCPFWMLWRLGNEGKDRSFLQEFRI